MTNPQAMPGGLTDVLKNNVWSYDPQSGWLSYDGYNVDLNSMADAEAVLDWIVQDCQKIWATPCVIGDLVLALDAILDIPGNYVTGRKPKLGKENGGPL